MSLSADAIAGVRRPWLEPAIVVCAVPILLVVAELTGLHRLVIAGAMGAALLAVCFVRPAVALVVLAFLAPFDGYTASMVVYRDFLVADVIGLSLIAGEVARRLRVPGQPAVIAALIILLLLGVSHVVSLAVGDVGRGWDNVARFWYFAALVAAIISARMDVPLRPIAAALVTAMVLRFSYEARAFFGDPAFHIHPSYQFGAWTSNPNTLAGFGACMVPLALAFVVYPATRAVRVVAFAAALLITGGVVLSFSKGAWLTLAVAGGLWTLHALRLATLSRRVLRAALVTAAIAFLIVPPLREVPGAILERWVSHGSALSNEERLRYAETAGELILQRPVLGVGLGRFAQEYIESRRLLRGPEDPHNAYLMVAVEMGVPALGLLVTLQLLGLVSSSISVMRARVSEAPMYAGLSAAAAGLLVFQLFSAEPLASRILWLTIALALTPPLPGDDDAAAV